MGNSDESPINKADPAPSSWERGPELVSLEFATWEHAAAVPGSWGKASRVADLKRMLPYDLTEPIYASLREVETRFLRRTEPIPPLRERLARDFDITTEAKDTFGLGGELHGLMKDVLTLGDVVPDWDARVAAALGEEAENVARCIRNFASLGLPRASFSLHYGYRFYLRRIPGRLLGAALATHSALLIGCRGRSSFQPGPLREFCDAFLQ